MGADRTTVAVLEYQVEEAKKALMRAELNLEHLETRLEAARRATSEQVDDPRTLLNG